MSLDINQRTRLLTRSSATAIAPSGTPSVNDSPSQDQSAAAATTPLTRPAQTAATAERAPHTPSAEANPTPLQPKPFIYAARGTRIHDMALIDLARLEAGRFLYTLERDMAGLGEEPLVTATGLRWGPRVHREPDAFGVRAPLPHESLDGRVAQYLTRRGWIKAGRRAIRGYAVRPGRAGDLVPLHATQYRISPAGLEELRRTREFDAFITAEFRSPAEVN